MTRWTAWLRRNDTRDFHLSRKDGWNAFANAAQREPLDLLTRAELDALTPAEREDYNEARSVWNANPSTVMTPQLHHAHAAITQVMATARRDGDRLRSAVAIDAPPGLGKTTIATRFAREFHRQQLRRHGPHTASGDLRVPVAYVPLSAGMTLKDLNRKLLRFYDHPAHEAATRAELGELAVRCASRCETRLIVLDDLHFIDFHRQDGSNLANHLKWLANEIAATFIYVGVDLTERHFYSEGTLAHSAQIGRRTVRCNVDPFEITTPSGQRAWTTVLARLEQHYLLADKPPTGMLTSLGPEIFRRTQGHMASLLNLLDQACYRAVSTGTETIDRSVLEGITIDSAAETATAPAAR